MAVAALELVPVAPVVRLAGRLGELARPADDRAVLRGLLDAGVGGGSGAGGGSGGRSCWSGFSAASASGRSTHRPGRERTRTVPTAVRAGSLMRLLIIASPVRWIVHRHTAEPTDRVIRLASACWIATQDARAPITILQIGPSHGRARRPSAVRAGARDPTVVPRGRSRGENSPDSDPPVSPLIRRLRGPEPGQPPDMASEHSHATTHHPATGREPESLGAVREPELERQGRRLGRPSWWFLALAALLAIPGILLVAFTSSWALALGIVLLALSGPPAVIGLGLLISSVVSRWAARHRSFA